MTNKYSILINTCDKFEDCWNPFFKLFLIYWPDFEGKIYLNTEYKLFSYPGLDIVCTKVCEINNVPKTQRATWSQCLKWALKLIDSDIILYMQEDYFFSGMVKNDKLHYFVDLMKKFPEIPCIQLTVGSIPAIKKSKFDNLYTSDYNFFSYVSCQAALWKKDILFSLVRGHETAWNFEWWGSKRAKYWGYEFLVVEPEILKAENSSIMPYISTGIVGGKWHRPVIKLFEKNQIDIDYTKRGFYNQNVKPTFKKRIETKVGIFRLFSILEILKLKYLT